MRVQKKPFPKKCSPQSKETLPCSLVAFDWHLKVGKALISMGRLDSLGHMSLSLNIPPQNSWALVYELEAVTVTYPNPLLFAVDFLIWWWNIICLTDWYFDNLEKLPFLILNKSVGDLFPNLTPKRNLKRKKNYIKRHCFILNLPYPPLSWLIIIMNTD